MSAMRRDLELDHNNQPIGMTVEQKIAQVRDKFHENDLIKTIFPGGGYTDTLNLKTLKNLLILSL